MGRAAAVTRGAAELHCSPCVARTGTAASVNTWTTRGSGTVGHKAIQNPLGGVALAFMEIARTETLEGGLRPGSAGRACEKICENK